MSPPEISVIIVHCNGRALLERCLPALSVSLQRQDATAETQTAEILLVDNGSRDDSRAWVAEHYPQVRVITAGRNLGFGRAVWLGVQAAAGEKLAFLHNDAEVTPDWLTRLNHGLDQRPEVMAVCSRLLLRDSANLINALGGGMSRLGHGYERLFGFSLDHPRVQALIERDAIPTLFPTTAAMLMRKADFLRLGGFDPAFFLYHEDIDLGWRIWLTGGEVQLCPGSVVHHARGASAAQLPPGRARDRMGMRHNVRTLIKCYQPRRLAHALLDQTRQWLAHRQYRDMLLILGWNLLHLPDTLRRRWHIQRRRVRHDRELFEAGLILVAPLPPWSPEPPDRSAEVGANVPTQNTELRLAGADAQAWLAEGWYPVELARRHPSDQWMNAATHAMLPPCGDLLPIRWTNGLAKCWLKTHPLAKGELRLRLLTPGREPCQQACASEPHWLEIHCGESAGSATRLERRMLPADSTWIESRLPAQADAHGCLALQIHSSTWSPDRPVPNQETRLLGVGLYDIRFVPDQDASSYSHHSAASQAGLAKPSTLFSYPLSAVNLSPTPQALAPEEVRVMSPPEISIILVNYNGRHHLERCLPALAVSVANASPDLSAEIILVDNGSSDDSLTWMAEQFPSVRVLAAKRNLGFGRANWEGVRAAAGRKVAFLNNDTEVAPDWLTPLNRTLEQQPRVMAVCSQLVLLEQPHIINALGGGMSRLGHSYDRLFGFSTDHPRVRELTALASFPALFPTAAAMLMRKADFLRLGGFDPAFFMYHEDVDLGWRIWLSGGEVHACPTSVVRHAYGGTTTKLQPSHFRDRMGMRHNLRTLIKCYQPRRLARALFDQTRIWLRRREYTDMLLILGWNLLHLPGTLIERWKIQRRRVLHDHDFFHSGLILIASHTPWGPSLPADQQAGSTPDRILSPKLRVGDETVSRRLDVGWYTLERAPLDAFAPGQDEHLLPTCIDPVPVRWTNGLARCRLWVTPNATGQLSLRLRTPGRNHHGETPWIEVLCGLPEGVQHRQHWHCGPQSVWTRLQLPATADSQGCLAVEIRSSTWAPESSNPSQEARIMGCGVYDLIFTPEDPEPPVFDPTPEDLTVIIPTYNRKPVLLRTLDALAKQSVRDFEVIVVDDGSSDGTAEALARWRKQQPAPLPFAFQVLRQQNMKQGVARNHGLLKARGDLILFLGDDITPDADFIAEHVRGHRLHNQAGDVAILGLTEWDRTTVRTTPFLQFVNYEGAQFGYNQLEPDGEAPFTCLYTSNISLRRSVLGVDPFDPRFEVYGWEDCELGLRLCSQGLRILYHPAARAVHSHQMSLSSFLRRQTQIGESLHTFMAVEPNLLSLPSMGNVAWQRQMGRFGPLLSLASPVLNLLDRWACRPWPARVYGLLLSIAFGRGVLKGERHSG